MQAALPELHKLDDNLHLYLALAPWVGPSFNFLAEHDDRLTIIVDFFRNALVGKKAATSIEIEARMGCYYYYDDLQWKDKALAHAILSPGHLQILPFKNKDIKRLFYFFSGVYKEQFDYLKHLLDEASKLPNSQVISKGHTLMLDTIFANNTRTTKNLATNATRSIRKLKGAEVDVQNCGQDFRIMVSTEEPLEAEEQGKVSFVREKSRYSYDCLFMGFDLTQVKVSGGDEYEVEMEVRDVEYMLKHVNDKEFSKLVRIFVGNIMSLYWVINEKFSKKAKGKHEQAEKAEC
eukprot:TRINITY_DN3303_c0_g1_i10.p1 TRINITY_DN3303_c0_g1~~TRINITY_DN3303_c0_g1_i10.p1  ORF type:complete len:291 (+),score=53.20 TRINITY_DN3303_c0_g1_i10:165-1037(+)